MTSGSFSETSLSHVLSNVSCQGSESNMLQCQYSTPDGCGATEDAAVVCQGKYKINDVSRISDLQLIVCVLTTCMYSGSLLIKRCLNYTCFCTLQLSQPQMGTVVMESSGWREGETMYRWERGKAE